MLLTMSNHRSPMAKFNDERSAHEAKMAKMESEMKAVFQQKVSEKESKLKASEDEVCSF
jgi:septin 7